jgi:glycerol kinase
VAAIEQTWRADRRFEPKMTEAERDRRYAGWQDAVRRIRHSATPGQSVK